MTMYNLPGFMTVCLVLCACVLSCEGGLLSCRNRTGEPCEHGRFCDTVSNVCEKCSRVCDNRTNVYITCRRFCPDEYQKLISRQNSTTAVRLPTTTVVIREINLEQQQFQSPPQQSDSWLIYVTVALFGLIVITIVMVGAFIFSSFRKKRMSGVERRQDKKSNSIKEEDKTLLQRPEKQDISPDGSKCQGSDLPPPGSKLQPLGSELQPPRSDFQPPGSEVYSYVSEEHPLGCNQSHISQGDNNGDHNGNHSPNLHGNSIHPCLHQQDNNLSQHHHGNVSMEHIPSVHQNSNPSDCMNPDQQNNLHHHGDVDSDSILVNQDNLGDVQVNDSGVSHTDGPLQFNIEVTYSTHAKSPDPSTTQPQFASKSLRQLARDGTDDEDDNNPVISSKSAEHQGAKEAREVDNVRECDGYDSEAERETLLKEEPPTTIDLGPTANHDMVDNVVPVSHSPVHQDSPANHDMMEISVNHTQTVNPSPPVNRVRPMQVVPPSQQNQPVQESQPMVDRTVQTQRQRRPPHPNKRIYDLLKGIDWVEGYYSEGRSIEVYCDLTYISPDVAMQELEVRTGESREKFHLLQSDQHLC